ncbi:MAG: hypothetical protein SH818_04605 [Saprospiraceae bacterium]|nr:hypothetical protein [Saprospiraceae bacterium]
MFKSLIWCNGGIGNSIGTIQPPGKGFTQVISDPSPGLSVPERGTPKIQNDK